MEEASEQLSVICAQLTNCQNRLGIALPFSPFRRSVWCLARFFSSFFFLHLQVDILTFGMQLFVGRLPLDVRTVEVEDIFYKYGRITRCDVKVRDKLIDRT